jgi:hypothetical protein
MHELHLYSPDAAVKHEFCISHNFFGRALLKTNFLKRVEQHLECSKVNSTQIFVTST